jgi:hypothetical protein
LLGGGAGRGGGVSRGTGGAMEDTSPHAPEPVSEPLTDDDIPF